MGKLGLLSECLENINSSCREHVLYKGIFTSPEMANMPHLEACHPVSHMVGIFLVARNVCFHVDSAGRV